MKLAPFPPEREQDQYDFNEVLLALDSCMPKDLQHGREFLLRPEVLDLNIGDFVYIKAYDQGYETTEVIGKSDARNVGGKICNGSPYVNRYGTENPEENPSNFRTPPKYRVKVS